MANLYMGRGGMDGLFGGSPSPPIRPGVETPQAAAPVSGPSNVMGPQAIRPTGPPEGFDPAYLQNLATSIGGLFARPQGNLSFNPLGNLSEISPPSGQMGNAPGYGEPTTWLQQALSGLSFLFSPSAQTPVPAGSGGGQRGGAGGGRYGGRPINATY